LTRTLSLDIGFDRDALESPANYRCPLLQVGFTVVDEDGNPIALARRLKPDDRVLVTFYDLTGGPTVEVSHLSFELKTRKARVQELDTPFVSLGNDPGPPAKGYITYPSHVIYPTLAGSSRSTVFEAKGPAWRAYPPVQPARRYPTNQLVSEGKPPRRRFQVARLGQSPPRSHYYTTCLLRVGWRSAHGQRRRTFRVDPEMIIDNNGKGSGGPPKR